MKRPLIASVMFLAAGIIFSRNVYPDIGLLWLFLAALSISIGLLLYFKQRIALIFPFFALLGFFLLQNSITDRYEILHDIASVRGNVSFTGVITSVSSTARGRTTAVVRTDEFLLGGEIFPARVNILAYLGFGDEATVGAAVRAEGNLQALRFRRNPGAYDEFTFLRTRKIQYTIFPNVFEEGTAAFFLPALPSLAVGRLQAVLHRVLPAEEAGILSSMILGDRTGLSDEARSIFRDAGVFHILAVSGMHVSIVALFLSKILAAFKLNQRIAGGVTLAFILFYCLMTGAAPGTVRAVVMSGTYIVGNLIYKRGDGLTSMAFAAIVLLIYEPLYLWDVGFQFSFAAVFSLLLLTPVILRLFGVLAKRYNVMDKLMAGKFFKGNVPAVLAATLATIPVQAFYFYQVPLLGFLSNLIVVPTLAITVSTGFLVGLVGQLSIGVAGLFALLPQFMVRFYIAVSDFFSSLPFFMLFTGRPRLIVIIVYVVVIVVIAHILKLRTIDYTRIHGKRVIKGALAALLLTFIISAAIPAPLTVTMLDVGQGDAVMVSYGGQAFLIDGGGRSLDRIGDDTGVWTVIPYMNYLGIVTLCAAFLSHSHADHAIGVIEVVEQGRVRTIYISYKDDADPEVLETLLATAERTGTRVVFVGAGDQMEFFGRVQVSILYPTATTALTGNNNSMVKMVDAGGIRFLFTGDIEEAAERELLLMYSDTNGLRADVLKVAHHGSRTSSSAEFLAAAGPMLAINSSGFMNIFNLPNAEVTERFYNMGIPLFRTDTMGAIRLFPRNNEIRILTMEALADERVKRPLKIR